MSNYSTVETDKAVIRIHLTDGTMKCFLVTQTQTANAVKFMVCKKLGLDTKEFNMFGLYVIENESSPCTDIAENPFNIHVKWTSKNNTKSKFLFKRVDEAWPPKVSQPQQGTIPSNASPTSSPQVESNAQPSYSEPSTSSSDGNEENYNEYESQGGDGMSGGGMSRGYGFGVTNEQLEAQRVAQAQRPAQSAKAQSRQGLIGWMNQSLAPLGMSITNLTTDMSDGVVLFRLLELITHKTLKGWHTAPTNMMLKLDNLNMFLRILGYFGIKISGISPEDIFSGNENIITAILLLMIKKYTPAFELEDYSRHAASDEEPSSVPEDPFQPVEPVETVEGQFDATNTSQAPAEEDMTPPAEEAPLPPPDRPPSSKINFPIPSSSPSSSITAVADPTSPVTAVTAVRAQRARSRMVTPEEQAQLASADSHSGVSATSPNGATGITPMYIARAPPKYAVDPCLTPDITSLLGPPVEMPLGNPGSLPIATPPTVNPAANIAQRPPTSGTPPPSQQPKLNGVPPSGQPKTLPPKQPANPPTGTLPTNPKSTGPKKAPAPVPGGGGPVPQRTGLPTTPVAANSPPAVKKVAVPPKTSTIPPTFGPKGGPPKMAGPKKVGAPGLKSPAPHPMASRPLPVPVAKSEPREEMDITFVPKDAMEASTTPAIEMDFSSPVPGSQTAVQASRARANTISNINTNIFDLDAFSDMENLLIGLAENI